MSFLAGKRVLVTGGAGFLGLHVCQELKTYSPQQIVVPRSAQCDLREPAVIGELFRSEQPQVVLHLAAVVGGIGANRVNPGRYFYENAVMGLHLLEQARRSSVEKFVSIGTICSYPKHTPVPFREEDLWNGYPEETNAPYGLAKKLLLVQGQSYRQQYGLNAITLLPVNLYGPGDNFDGRTSHVIPALIRKAIEARDAGQDHIEVWGTGGASREFLFVRDAARAICAAAEQYDEPQPMNIGSGNEISIRELVPTICQLCGFEGEIRWDATKPDGQPRRCLDTSRARNAFGFEAKTSLRDGLMETIDWYERHRDELLEKESRARDEPSDGDRSSLVAGTKSETASNPDGHHHVRRPSSVHIHTAAPRSSDAGGSVRDAREQRSKARSVPGRTALITGITGQDGSYLAELLVEKGYEVHGVVRRNSSVTSHRLTEIAATSDAPRPLLHYGDVTDAASMIGLVLKLEPDEIYNLAAQSHVGVSFDKPCYTADVAATGALNMLEAARLLNERRPVRYYQASTSEMFGGAPDTAPQSETTPFHPRSPYGCAKAYAHYQTVNYREAYDIFACCGILFNHESPRRGESFVTRKITLGAARIAVGLQDKLYLGNLEALRDWGYAKDYVESMWLMLQHHEADDYVIATGRTHTIREFLELTFGYLGLDWRKYVEISPKYFRPAEVNLLQGDASKAREILGWVPSTQLDSLVEAMLESDMKLARSETQRVDGPQTVRRESLHSLKRRPRSHVKNFTD